MKKGKKSCPDCNDKNCPSAVYDIDNHGPVGKREHDERNSMFRNSMAQLNRLLDAEEKNKIPPINSKRSEIMDLLVKDVKLSSMIQKIRDIDISDAEKEDLIALHLQFIEGLLSLLKD